MADDRWEYRVFSTRVAPTSMHEIPNLEWTAKLPDTVQGWTERLNEHAAEGWEPVMQLHLTELFVTNRQFGHADGNRFPYLLMRRRKPGPG